MSGWLWSSPPPSDELSEAPIAEGITHDPYASQSSSSTDVQPAQESFGSAFGDDLQYENSSTTSQNSFDNTSSSFNVYAGSDTTPSPYFPSDSLNQSDAIPTVDFGSMGRINPNVLSARSNAHLDYVFTDDYQEVRRKGVGEQLTSLAGTSYLLGGTTGGLIGLSRALRESSGKSTRLRINAILNATGKRGAMFANACGICALAFSIVESVIYNYTSDESLSSYAAAGAITGALYKSTRGPRLAGIWAIGGATLALGTVYASRKGVYGRGLQGVL